VGYNTRYDVVYNALVPQVTHNFLSDEEMKKIINDPDLKDVIRDGEVVGLAGDDTKSIRDVRLSPMLRSADDEYNNKYKWLQEKILNHIKNAVIARSDFKEIDVDEVAQMDLLRYNYGGKYSWHTDSTSGTSGTSHNQRKFTAVILLSERDVHYTGGFLKIEDYSQLLEIGNKDYLGRGSIVVFPSYMTHIVSPITSGTMYSIVAWGEGPYWR